MIRCGLAVLFLSASLLCPAAAQERVTVGTMQNVASSVLFLGAAKGYFKDEGLDVEMTAYASNEDVVKALAGDATDFGLASFTAAAFNAAGSGAIKAIAMQAREKRDYEGSDIIVSNAAYARGIRKAEQLASTVAAIDAIGTTAHYQLGQVAHMKDFKLSGMILKPQGSPEAVASAIAADQVDVAILPSQYARDLLTANQAKLVAWYSELDEPQLGALFVSRKTIAGRRATVEKFLRAYRRGAAEYYASLMRRDKYSKRVSNAKSREAATAIARYVYPGRANGAPTVEAYVYFIDPQAQLDTADIKRQVDWYRAQGLVNKEIDARAVVDLSFK
jgi:NitT/TauT family transport system substrate-binding protein